MQVQINLAWKGLREVPSSKQGQPWSQISFLLFWKEHYSYWKEDSGNPGGYIRETNQSYLVSICLVDC